MELLALDDPVFVVDLCPRALQECAADLAGEATPPEQRQLPPVPAQPVRALALLLEPEADPVLIAIEPTRDVEALDATARLLRVALVSGRSVRELATKHGDAALAALYHQRRLPALVYDGFPDPVRGLLPPGLVACVP